MDIFPSEIKSIVVSYLDSRSLRALRLANTQWFNKVHYCDFVFNFTTEERVPQIIQRLSKYNYPIGLTFDKSRCILSPSDYEDIGRLTQLTKLMFGTIRKNADPDSFLTPLTNLTNLREVDKVPADIVRHLTRLQSIALTNAKDAKGLDLTRFTNLQEVVWSSFNEYISAEYLLLSLLPTVIQSLRIDSESTEKLDLNFPQLTKLHIVCPQWCFNLSNLPNIEKVFINADRISGLAQLQTLTSLKLFSQTAHFTEFGTLARLKELSFHWPKGSDQTFYSLQFLTALTNLESLAVNKNDKNEITERQFDKALQFFHSKKLTHLDYLHISSNYFNSARFNQLQSLEINLCEAAVLEQLQHLTRLKIAKVEPHLFDAIEKLTALRSLELILAPSAKTNESKRKLSISKLSALQNIGFTTQNAKARAFLDLSDIQNVQLKSIAMSSVNDSFMEKISGITTLESLGLSSSLISSDDSLLYLTKMTNLTFLFIIRANMTGNNLTLLTSLQQLIFFGTTLEEKELKQKLTKLHFLSIRK